MPESRTEIRRPKATVTTPIQAREVVSSMSMTLSVDTSPTVEFVTHPKVDAREKAVRMGNRAAAVTVGRGQTTIFKSRSAPDTTITVEDGTGNTLKFIGFYSNPSYTYGVGSAGLQQTAIHESAAVDSLVPDIYAGGAGDGWKFDHGEITGDNAATRIKSIQNRIIEVWETEKEDLDLPAKEKIIRDQIAVMNTPLFKIWYKILDNSVQSMGWEEIEKLTAPQKDTLDDAIHASLLQQTDSFFDVMIGFNAMFQSVWIPDMAAGQYGKFVRRRTVFENRITKLVTPIRARFSGGASRLLPITHCIVQSTGTSWWKSNAEGDKAVTADIIAAWPEKPFAGGRFLRDPGPIWLGKPELPTTEVDDYDSGRLDMGAYLEHTDSVTRKEQKDADSIALEIAAQWARDIYNWNALSGASASLDIPMDLTIMPGQFLDIKTEEGLLFSGFVYTVRHDLVAGDNGSGGQASTSIMFTNVEAGEFKLPNR